MHEVHQSSSSARMGWTARPRGLIMVSVAALALAACGTGSTGSTGSMSSAGSMSSIGGTGSSGNSGSMSSTGSSGSSGGTGSVDTAPSSSSDQAGAQQKDASLADEVPKEIRTKGALSVAVAGPYPSAVISAKVGDPISGADPALIHAIGQVLGLEIKTELIPFAGLIPALQAGRYDVAIGAVGITDERRTLFSFVSTNLSTYAFLVKKDSTLAFNTMSDLCGRKVALTSGSVQLTGVQQVSTKCKAEGKPAVDIRTFAGNAEAILAVQSGQAEINVAGVTALQYTADQNPTVFKAIPDKIKGFLDPGQTGIMLADTSYSPALAKAIGDAVNLLIDNGAYQKILDEYYHGLNGLSKAEVLPKVG